MLYAPHEEQLKILSTGYGDRLNEPSINVRAPSIDALWMMCDGLPSYIFVSRLQFTKSYLAGGHLATGRAVIIVSVGWGGQGMSDATTFWGVQDSAGSGYSFPALHGATNLILCWAPNAECNPGVASASVAAAPTQTSAITMSLFTHSLYRMDSASSQPWWFSFC